MAADHSRRAWPQDQQDKLVELIAQKKKNQEIADIIGRPLKGVISQRRKMGLYTPKPPRAPIPDDFAQWAVGKTLRQIQRHLGVGYEIAAKLRVEYGLPMIDPAKAKMIEMPEDFADVAPRLTMGGCERHYGRSHNTIKRWYDEAGIVPAPYVAPVRNSRSVNWGSRQPVNFGATGDNSIASAAANHLRRVGFVNVYRATVLDKPQRQHLPEEGRCHYVVSGRGFLHQDDLIALAAANGWQVAA